MHSRTTSSEVRYAGLLPRAAAYLVDCLLIFLFFALTQLLIFVPIRSGLGIDNEWFRSGIQTELYTLLTVSLPAWLYFTLSEGSQQGATLGKRLLRLQVVEAGTRESPGTGRTLIRTIVKLLPWEIAHISNNLPTPLMFETTPEFRIGFVFVGLLSGIYMVMIGFDRKKRGLHDRLAGTLVVRKENE